MSLCIAMNNPNNFVIMAGDGRITSKYDGRIIKDNHPKITQLTNHVVMFSSGIQELAEELRNIVKSNINDCTAIETIAELMQKQSLRLHKDFLRLHPEYENELSKGYTTIATLLGFYDIKNNTCGYIEYSHENRFIPMIHIGSTAKTRGIGQNYALELLLSNFSKLLPINNILNTYRLVSLKEKQVGGVITVFVVHKNGIRVIQREMILQ